MLVTARGLQLVLQPAGGHASESYCYRSAGRGHTDQRPPQGIGLQRGVKGITKRADN